jgi:4-hydroxybenzoate polyprenyltransferase
MTTDPSAPQVQASSNDAISPTPDTSSRDAAAVTVPLCVDLDGSLLRTDLLWETLFAALGEKPGLAFALPGWIGRGKSSLKHRLAAHAAPDAESLPYHEDLLAFLRQQKAAGRTLVLATASHQTYADAVAAHLDLFDHVIGSDETNNRRGASKVEAIRAAVGETFDYVGDSDADLPLIAACRKFHRVGDNARLTAAAEKAGKTERSFVGSAGGLKPLVKLIRPHQWSKNALIFIPMIMGHQFDLATFGWALLGFVAFCCAASSIYIFNDLVDIESDRRHPTKRRRPLAAATVSVPTALKTAVGLLGIAAVTAGLAGLGPGGLAFPGWVLLYLLLTTAYSFSLKRRLLVDVIVLGWLYTHRVLAGGIVTGVNVSQWLLAFSAFLFISLAFAKRYTELRNAKPGKANARRGYRPEDLPLIGNIGPTAGFMALLIFSLYLNGEDAQKLYDSPWLLWLVVPVMMFWILRVWFLAFRGELHDDPIVFAIRDKVSYACFVAAVALLLAASWPPGPTAAAALPALDPPPEVQVTD